MKVSWINYFLGASVTLLLGARVGSAAELSRWAMDSSVGKSPSEEVAKEAAPMWTVGQPIDDDSSMGKKPLEMVYAGPPPRSKGPGLNFDTKKYFYVYSDGNGLQNHYAPSGWMGDYSDIRFNDHSHVDPADGRTCIEVTYTPRLSEGNGWAGIYWQEPRNNWGDITGGYNLSGMKRLTFWARGAQGGEYIAVFKVGGIHGNMADTGEASIGPVYLSKEWRQYAINLADTDLTKISGGFAWATNATPVPETFYIDEIRFER